MGSASVLSQLMMIDDASRSLASGLNVYAECPRSRPAVGRIWHTLHHMSRGWRLERSESLSSLGTVTLLHAIDPRSGRPIQALFHGTEEFEVHSYVPMHRRSAAEPHCILTGRVAT